MLSRATIEGKINCVTSYIRYVQIGTAFHIHRYTYIHTYQYLHGHQDGILVCAGILETKIVARSQIWMQVSSSWVFVWLTMVDDLCLDDCANSYFLLGSIGPREYLWRHFQLLIEGNVLQCLPRRRIKIPTTSVPCALLVSVG